MKCLRHFIIVYIRAIFYLPQSLISHVDEAGNSSVAASASNITNIGPGAVTKNQPIETKVENGELLMDRCWYQRGQSVEIEGREIRKFAATIMVIKNDVVSITEKSSRISTQYVYNNFFTFRRFG